MKNIIVLVLLLCTFFANASSTFKETRYVYALDKNISFEGFITFGEHNIMIEYNKPESKVLTYFEDTLTIQDQSGYTTVNVQSMPSLSYFFMIIKAVHDENALLLDSFFDTTVTNENQTHLAPKGVTAEILESVSIKRRSRELKALHVKIKNGDRISIEIMD